MTALAPLKFLLLSLASVHQSDCKLKNHPKPLTSCCGPIDLEHSSWCAYFLVMGHALKTFRTHSSSTKIVALGPPLFPISARCYELVDHCPKGSLWSIMMFLKGIFRNRRKEKPLKSLVRLQM